MLVQIRHAVTGPEEDFSVANHRDCSSRRILPEYSEHPIDLRLLLLCLGPGLAGLAQEERNR